MLDRGYETWRARLRLLTYCILQVAAKLILIIALVPVHRPCQGGSTSKGFRPTFGRPTFHRVSVVTSAHMLTYTMTSSLFFSFSAAETGCATLYSRWSNDLPRISSNGRSNISSFSLSDYFIVNNALFHFLPANSIIPRALPSTQKLIFTLVQRLNALERVETEMARRQFGTNVYIYSYCCENTKHSKSYRRIYL